MRWMADSVVRLFFFFRGEGYAYLNGPPIPHERIAHRSRHSVVKTNKIFASAVFVVVAVLSRSPDLSEPRLLPNTFSRHCPACSGLFRQLYPLP